MSANIIDAQMLRRMFLSGAKNLELQKEWINQLNVFPVPDGDTGTNMTLTIMSAAQEVSALPADAGIEMLSKAISGGSLRGARGNSGVILSQLFRGFTKEIREYRELDIPIIASAMERAVETAYKAVMKPKEGTILTVARAMSEKGSQIRDQAEDLGVFFEEILAEGQAALERTPELLPVLKEAGVVDSGGEGLMAVLRGCFNAYLGKELELSFETPVSQGAAQTSAAHKEISTDEIKFGYCTEFIINLEKPFPEEEERQMKAYLTSIGDSLVLVADEDIVKIHVHTNHPGLAFEKGLEYGNLCRMKIDNMRIEHQEKLFKEAEMQAARKEEEVSAAAPEGPRSKNGFISVTIGEGMSEIFRGLGVNVLIEGGQTMNPSTDDMLSAIREVHAENVFILPNNKNVILAANQAKDLVEDCNVVVVPTKTVPQGITAMIAYNPDKSPEENIKVMSEEIALVHTIEVTYSVRDTKIDGKEIHTNDIMAIGDEGILAVGSDVKEVILQALEAVVDEESELISVYNGMDYSEEDTEELVGLLEEKFPEVDVESNFGGQPIYYCILSVE